MSARTAFALGFLLCAVSTGCSKPEQKIEGRALRATLDTPPENVHLRLASRDPRWTPEHGTLTDSTGGCVPGNAVGGGATVSGGCRANAPSVVASMAGGFRTCFKSALEGDPNMRGSMRVTAKIGPEGQVLGASPSDVKGLSTQMQTCVAAVVAAKRFDAPEGGGATIVIPVSFAPQ